MADSGGGHYPPGRAPRGGKRRNKRRGRGGQTAAQLTKANAGSVENTKQETCYSETTPVSHQEDGPTVQPNTHDLTCISPPAVVDTSSQNTEKTESVKTMESIVRESMPKIGLTSEEMTSAPQAKVENMNRQADEPSAPPAEVPPHPGKDSMAAVGSVEASAVVEPQKGENKGKKQGGKGQGKKDKPDGQQGGQQGAEGTPAKSKAQLKAERRALQEAQRAAKAAKQEGGGGGGGGKKKGPQGGGDSQKKQDAQAAKAIGGSDIRVPDKVRADDPKSIKRHAKKLEKQQIPQRTVVQKKVGLFNHLHQYEREFSLTKNISFSPGAIHPAILRLGLQYAEGIICGSNARCVALLAALKQVISDYKTPPQKELSRDLDARLKPCISFLEQCRPKSISMGNAIKQIKQDINNIEQGTPDNEAKESLCEKIDEFYEVHIKAAGSAISQMASEKIKDGDVILTYACSSLIQKVLCDAHATGKKFRVIVVDGRPKLEGREMLRRLVKAGIECSYVLINAASYVMKEVTKVMLGAHALLANGYVMSRVGSSQVALIAKSYNVPVLVCCETYKFCEKVLTDSFVYNELGDPDDLVQIQKQVAPLSDWRDKQSLNLLNLMYDVTPSEFVSMVITEIAVVPCTSVPVVLRLKHTQ